MTEYRLGDICKVINGRAYRQPELLDAGKYPVLRVGNFFSSDRWFYSDLELPEDKQCDDGDLLFAWSASFGPRIWDGGRVIYHYHIWKLEPNETIVDKYYLYYWLRKSVDILTAGTHGSVMAHMTKGDMENQRILLPCIEEQRKVGRTLRLLDDKIKVNSKINDNLQQQAATVFHQWFVANPESEKWPSVTLDSLTSLVSRGIAPKYTDDSVQIVLNQKCIRDHYIDVSLARRHNPKVINEKWLQYGDLLINSTGEGTLGRAAQVWFVPDNMTVDSHVTIVRPKGPHLLFYIGLWGISHEREIEALHTGSTGQTELPRERVKAMELRLPDNDTLARFNAVIAPIVSLIITNQQENVRLASIRDALLPKLMSGEIDVTDIQL